MRRWAITALLVCLVTSGCTLLEDADVIVDAGAPPAPPCKLSCSNNGTCVSDTAGGHCDCPTGFSGSHCEVNVNDCAQNPCQNGGTCVDGVNSYSCSCPNGFSGSHCEVNVNDCAQNPCQNGGTCVDGVNSYSCSCPNGFSGSHCEVNVNDCAQNPCQNGGTCVDGVNSYSCSCPNGFSGNHCEVNTNDCAQNPCQNGGTCVDGVNSYSCSCPNGFSGSHCEVNINDCAQNPCQNGGTCVDGVNSYSCSCPNGFSGSHCEVNVNDCAQNPCQNGGTCVDGVNSYSCSCPNGFSGSHCEVNVNDCAQNPCQNGGTCVDGVNSYSCSCPNGFSGSHCEVNVNDCAQNPCQNGGTCVDGVNSYSCSCPSGFSGSHCEVAPTDPLLALSDEFDSPSTLAQWQRVYQLEQWPYDQLELFDISQSQPGSARLVPYTGGWYNDYRGVLAFKSVSGNVIVSARLTVSNRAGNGAPTRVYSLAGLMLRTPRAITASTWQPGGENYVFLSLGTGDQAGRFQSEVKTTLNSNSVLHIAETPNGDQGNSLSGEIRIARLGPHVICLLRFPGQPWQIHRRYYRPDMPATLQIGMTAYTDWPGMSQFTPETHNTILITPEAYPGVFPDLDARYDYVRFRTPVVPAAYQNRQFSDPNSISDSELLTFLGN